MKANTKNLDQTAQTELLALAYNYFLNSLNKFSTSKFAKGNNSKKINKITLIFRNFTR